MRNGNRKFYQGEVTHVYQRAINGFNIFYELNDYIVFYTLFSVFVKRNDVIVLALCLMVDHFHALLICPSKPSLSKFISSVTATYARMFNATIERKGQLFDKSFGSASKIAEKQIRTTISYLFNNPVEKNICSDPSAYKWNFLAYMDSDCPFSKKMVTKRMRAKLMRTIKEVDQSYRLNRWLNYVQLSRMFKGLSEEEALQLTDYIIIRYLPFDKEKLLSYYKSLDMMRLAIESNTGSEYDLKEEFNRNSDLLYKDVADYVNNSMSVSLKSLLMLPLNEKIKIADRIAVNTHASRRQIAKSLHIVLKKNSRRGRC